MTYDELIEKKEELEVKIEKLNEDLRFGSSGNISGINALSNMRKNLELVNAALETVEKPAVKEEVSQEQTQEETQEQEQSQETQPSTAPPAPPTDGNVIEEPQQEQLGTS